ncbi:coiled-coil domain-containing protein 169 [Manis pentadactyla]|uniref:coiled-coil domain-containing protein 169 n=1 Tax=Manis pentadactyla TaxID=143292 RepID=UPI00255D102D|nr:coiled-coil domain-containing protein 169 [Manis pentadactyla]
MATPPGGAALPQVRGGRQESLTMLLKQLEKEKRSLESQVKGNTRRQEQELKKRHSDIRYYGGVLLKTFSDFAVREDSAKVSGSYLVSKRQQMDQLPRMKENLVKMGRSPINQKTMNGKRGPVKNSSISNHLPKLSL